LAYKWDVSERVRQYGAVIPLSVFLNSRIVTDEWFNPKEDQNMMGFMESRYEIHTLLKPP